MTKTVNVRIFGREEIISCEESEVDDLIQAAAMLDAEMGKTKDSVRQPMAFDKLCLLSSLNLLHRLLISERLVADYSKQINSLLGLRKQLKNALEPADEPKAKPATTKLL